MLPDFIAAQDRDFFRQTVDGKPALLFVDLGLRELLPVASHPVSGYVRVTLLQPQADGQMHPAEAASMDAIEIALWDALTPETNVAGAIYPGRCMSRGFCDFYFYLPVAHGFKARIKAVAAEFEPYHLEGGTRADRNWNIYRDYLFPDAFGQALITSRRQCRALSAAGDALTEPRTIAHWAVFPTEAKRQDYMHSTLLLNYTQGYSTDGRSGIQPWGIQLTHSAAPSQDSMARVVNTLAQLAHAAGGVYEGWTAAAVASVVPSAQ